MMNPYTKAVLSVLRLAAIALILLGPSLCASDLFLYLSNRPIAGPWRLALKGLPTLAGVILYWKSRGAAVRLTKDLD
jgi:hypothetical protein